MTGGETGPRTQRLRGPEPRDVTDLSDEDRRDGSPYPVERLDGLIATIVAQLVVDLTFQHDDFTVIDRDEITSDSTRTVYASASSISSRETLPARPEHVVEAG